MAGPADRQPKQLNLSNRHPGELSITWNAIGVRGILSNSTSIQLMVDGKTTPASSTTQTTTLTIGPGSHSIRPYLNPASPPPIAFRIYNISFTPWDTVPLDVAAGSPGRFFSSGGAGWWTGLVSPALAPEGTALIWGQPGFTTPGTDDALWLATTVEGPADISFWWRVQNPVYTTRLTFTTASLFPAQLNPFNTDPLPSSSGTHRTSLGPGTHTLRWAISGSLSPVQLDQLRITPRTVYSLDVAADLPGQVLTPVTGQWFGVDSPLALTGNSLIEVRSSSGGNNAVQMTAPVTGPGILRFHWRLAKPYSASEMRVTLDNNWAATLARSNSTAWKVSTWWFPPAPTPLVGTLPACPTSPRISMASPGHHPLPTSPWPKRRMRGMSPAGAHLTTGGSLSPTPLPPRMEWMPSRSPRFLAPAKHCCKPTARDLAP